MEPINSFQLTPSTISHADFNADGHLVIGTLSQVAVFKTDGSLISLLDLPRAQTSWQPVWLTPHLIVVKDNQEFLLWQPFARVSDGPWRPRDASISRVFNVQGRILLSYADGIELFQTRLPGTADTSLPAFSRLPEASAQLRQVVSADNGFIYKAYSGGVIIAADIDTHEQAWATQLNAGDYVRALTVNTHSLFVIMQQSIDTFAHGRGQSLIEISLDDGKVIQVAPLDIDSQAVSALADEPYLFVGGSENCVFVVQATYHALPLCYPRIKRWSDSSGQVIALYKNADKLFAVTSSGHLQIWQKQDIVSLITDK